MTTPPRIPFLLSASCVAAELRAAAEAARATNNPRLAALLEQRARYWDTIDLDAESATDAPVGAPHP